jgi:hypothetical protein
MNNTIKTILSFIPMLLGAWLWCETASAIDYKIGPLETSVDLKDWSMSTEEKIWQVGHLLDVLQTARIHREDCYQEGNVMTRRQIGRNPSTGKVIAWGLVHSAIQHYQFKLVENSNMPKWLQHALKWAAITYKYDTVYHNHQLGIRIGASAKIQPDEYGHCTW